MEDKSHGDIIQTTVWPLSQPANHCKWPDMLAGLAIRLHLSLGTSEDLVALGSAWKRWVTNVCAGMTHKELILPEDKGISFLKSLPGFWSYQWWAIGRGHCHPQLMEPHLTNCSLISGSGPDQELHILVENQREVYTTTHPLLCAFHDSASLPRRCQSLGFEDCTKICLKFLRVWEHLWFLRIYFFIFF